MIFCFGFLYIFVFVYCGSGRKLAHLSHTGDLPYWKSLAGRSNAGASVIIHHMHRRYRAAYYNAQLPLDVRCKFITRVLGSREWLDKGSIVLVGSIALHLSAATRCQRLSRHIACYLASCRVTQSVIDLRTLNSLASHQDLTHRAPACPSPALTSESCLGYKPL
jgi:hypothetical protein